MATSKKRIAAYVFLAVLIIAGGVIWWNFLARRTAPPPVSNNGDIPLTATVAEGLQIPWEIAFLPDGRIILTERPGSVRLIDASGALIEQPLLVIDDVAATGEGGLLGLALHPEFSQTGWVYLYYTYRLDGGLANRVVRYTMQGSSLVDRSIVIEGIPGGGIHDGGRIKFGPDGRLYIGAGDSGVADLAQDLDSLAGKILRLNDDGTIPPDNPFPGSPVYSYGHRNPQGLAWDDRGRLWETEHGSSAFDELNLIQAGGNYGWPVVRGDGAAAGMIAPVHHSGNDTWAPSGLEFFDGSLSTNCEQLLRFDPATNELSRHFNGSFGQLRNVYSSCPANCFIF